MSATTAGSGIEPGVHQLAAGCCAARSGHIDHCSHDDDNGLIHQLDRTAQPHDSRKR
jgi:hypothetical protein